MTLIGTASDFAGPGPANLFLVGCLIGTEIRNRDWSGDREFVASALIAKTRLNRKGVRPGRHRLDRAGTLRHIHAVYFCEPRARPAKAIYELAIITRIRTVLRYGGEDFPFAGRGLLRNSESRPE